MAANLTEKEFSQHVGTNFALEVEQVGVLTLAEVKAYMPKENEQSGMERFSLYFDGPGNAMLPQAIYRMRHEAMGEFDIFLVPIRGDEKGFRYEAVFNYHK